MTYSLIGGIRRFGKPQSQFEPGKGDIVTTSLKKNPGKRKNLPRDEIKDPMRKKKTPDPNNTIGPDYGVRGGNLDCKGIIAQRFQCLGFLSAGMQHSLNKLRCFEGLD